MRPSEQLTELSEIFTQSTSGPRALAEILPGHMIEEAIAEHGREGQRKRKLLPPTVVWLVVGICLFSDLSIKNVLRKLVQELGLDVSWGMAEVPINTSTTHARDRLGWQVTGLAHRHDLPTESFRQSAGWGNGCPFSGHNLAQSQG